MDSDQIRREDARLATLAALYDRQQGAFEAPTIKTVFLKSYDFTVAEIEAALEFLIGLEFVKALHDPLGATKSYQITAKGILHKERHAQ